MSHGSPIARQILGYCLASGAALLVHLAVLVFLVSQLAVPKAMASAFGFLCAVPVNFYLQRRFVFESEVDVIGSFATYCIITFATLILNTLVFWAIISWTDLHYTVAQIGTTLSIALVNFLANRTYTFRRREL